LQYGIIDGRIIYINILKKCFGGNRFYFTLKNCPPNSGDHSPFSGKEATKVLKSRTHGDIPKLHHAPSWRGVNCLIKEGNDVEHTLIFWFARFFIALMYSAGTEVTYE